jgi:hypothetical protein
MDELSTPPIPGSIPAGDGRQQRPHPAPHRPEKRLRIRNRETEINEQDEPIDDSEQEHHVDISV